ncbi:MAG: hypothetical protein M3065_21105 [Actinomycetota bacterium]|nr:hypothetical protein [Actinomycetota bacterium]
MASCRAAKGDRGQLYDALQALVENRLESSEELLLARVPAAYVASPLLRCLGAFARGVVLERLLEQCGGVGGERARR